MKNIILILLAISVSHLLQAQGKNWFPEYDMENCQMLYLSTDKTLDFCAISKYKTAKERTFLITLRDPSRLDKTDKNRNNWNHVLVHSISPEIKPGEYMIYEGTFPTELSNGFFLFHVLFGTGEPDTFKAGRSVFYLYDSNKNESKIVWRSPTCPEGCTDMQIQLTYKKNEPHKIIEYLEIAGSKSKIAATLKWDGKQIQKM